MIYIYARVSTNHQEAQSQITEIDSYCARKGYQVALKVIVKESSRSSLELRKIAFLKEKLQSGDVLITTELTRIGRSFFENCALIQYFLEKGVKLEFTREGGDFDTPEGKLILGIRAGIAEIERERIRERIKAGLLHAKKSGKKLGRPADNGLSPVQIDLLKQEVKQGKSKRYLYTEMINKGFFTQTYSNFVKILQ